MEHNQQQQRQKQHQPQQQHHTIIHLNFAQARSPQKLAFVMHAPHFKTFCYHSNSTAAAAQASSKSLL